MSEVIAFRKGGFRYIKGVFQYLAGVADGPGFEIERARFARPVPLAEGFVRIEARLVRGGRPTTACCASELRAPDRHESSVPGGVSSEDRSGRDRRPAMFKHLLIPTDGSELANNAISAGIQLAKALGAKVTAYHAIEEPDVQGVGDEAFIATRAIKEFELRLRERGERFLAPVQAAAKAAGVPCEILITNPRTPAEGIVTAASEAGCDAICMASHGRGDIASLLLGSVTHKVLAHAKVPVVVFR